MREIGRWTARRLGRRSTRLGLFVVASVASVAFLACMALLTAVLLGSVAVKEGDAPTSPTQAIQLPHAGTVTHVPEDGVAGASVMEDSTPQDSAPQTPAADTSFESPVPLGPTPTRESRATGETVSAMGAIVPVATLEPIDVPGPVDALQLVSTAHLTLSKVIFVENEGQFPDAARFQVRGSGGGGVWLAQDGIWMTLLAPATGQLDLFPERIIRSSPADAVAVASQSPEGVQVRLSFVGANSSPDLEPFRSLATHASYFRGTDETGWHAQVPVWGGVRYVDLYPGIDLELVGEGEDYVQRLVVHAGADLNQVKLRVDGVDALRLEAVPGAPPERDTGSEGIETASSTSGNRGEASYLVLTTALGEVALPLFQVVAPDGDPLDETPEATPRITDDGLTVEAPFFLYLDEDTEQGQPQGFSLRPDDPADLLYLNFLGKGGTDSVYGVAVDGAGNAYLAGHSYLPLELGAPGAFDPSSSGSYESMVTKLAASGTETAYLVIVGGGADDSARDVAVDRAGGVYVTGSTRSADLTLTADAFRTTYGGGSDAFLFKVDADGTGLAYATYLGGKGDDWGRGIAVDGDGSAYVAGATESPGFPVTVGAADAVHGDHDAFVAKFNAQGSGLAYATFLGGSAADDAWAIAVDDMGHAYVAGATESIDFPTEKALDPSYNGGQDAFVAKLDRAGTSLVYSTFLGGQDADGGSGIAVGRDGSAYLTGYTRSSDFPSVDWASDSSYGGGYDAFVLKLEPAGTALDYATFLGEGGDEWGQAIAVDSMDHAYVTGSGQIPPAADASTPTAGHEEGLRALVVRLDALGTDLAYATYLSGDGDGHGRAIAVDGMGSAYVAGMAEARPGAAGAAGQLWDAFVSKLVVGTPFLDLPVSYTNFALAALGNVGDRGLGRVNSWFDHNTPNHARNRSLVRWDGVELALSGSHLPRIGESWYDGHGGIDFHWDVLDESIYAAAPGTVVDTVDNCRLGDQSCGNGFGNRVWIDHGNGYATVYAHLKSVQVAENTLIVEPAAQPLGIMGNTGRSLGTHLHFALYFDRNGDRQWTREEVVDPYGWLGSDADPWRGHSRYLWKQPLSTQQIVGGPGNEPSADGRWILTSPSGLVTVTIPAEAVASTALMQLWDMPPAVAPSAGWRPTGRSFLLEARRLDGALESGSPLFVEPLSLQMAFRKEDTVHLDLDELTLQRWDDQSRGWKPVQTEVDSDGRQVLAQTSSAGRFDLHAPLSCPVDGPEPDDHYASAQTVRADGSGLQRVFDMEGDVDWLRFEAEARALYLVQVRPLADGVRPEVRLYDPDSIRRLASGKGLTSTLQWRAPENGVWLLRISQPAGAKHGCDAVYEISVGQLIAAQSVAIRGPAAGTVGAGYTFTATVSPTLASLPLTYAWQITGGAAETHTGALSNTLSFAWETPSTYQIQVEVSNAAGKVSGSHSIVVHPPVDASFEASARSGRVPHEVRFTNTSQGDYDRVRWEFGDGTEGQAKNPTHTYETPGLYTVTLRLSGPGGSDEITKEEYIMVEPAPLQGDHWIYLPLVRNKR